MHLYENNIFSVFSDVHAILCGFAIYILSYLTICLKSSFQWYLYDKLISSTLFFHLFLTIYN